MKNGRFNFVFWSLNLFALLLAVFVFPNYEKIPFGLVTQILFIVIVLSLIINFEGFISSPRIKAMLGGLFLLLSCYYCLDSFSIYRSSYHFAGLVQIALLGGDVTTTLKEVGIPPFLSLILLLLPIMIYVLTIKIYQKLSTRDALFKASLKIPSLILTLVFATGFVVEQSLQQSSDSYLQRSQSLPLYPTFFSSDWKTFSISPAFTQDNLNKIIASSSLAANPKNILLIILEGVPPDMLDETATPFLTSFAKKAIPIEKSMTEAIATHLALNSLLFNRSAYSFENDIEVMPAIESAALPFEIYKKSGYKIYLGVSTDFSMKFDEARALGKNSTVDYYFKGFNGQYVGRHITDQLTTDQALIWLRKRDIKKPFVMVLQLDATHWPYEFDETTAVFKPYLTSDRLDKFDSHDSTQLVINRYKNAVNQLDKKLERIVSSVDQNTAVAIVSDHGENFNKGFVTHLNLSNRAKNITNLIFIPGSKNTSVSGIATHRDIWPTFFDFTGIQFPEGRNPFSGYSLLKRKEPRTSLLTFNGNLRLAELTYPNKIIHFRVQVNRLKLSLSPYMITNLEGNPLLNWKELLKDFDWASDIQKSL